MRLSQPNWSNVLAFSFGVVNVWAVSLGVVVWITQCRATIADEVTSSPFAIVAGAKIEGDGKRLTPFVFRVGSLGKLTTAEAVEWILDDCPEDTEALETNKGILFPTEIVGVYHVICVSSSKASHAWFEVRSGAGPPVPDSKAKIAAQVTQAFVGPDSKTDAAKWKTMWSAVLDSLEQCEDTADVYNASEAASKAVQFPVGKYPKLAPILVATLPKQGTNDPLTPAHREELTGVFRAFISGAEGVK